MNPSPRLFKRGGIWWVDVRVNGQRKRESLNVPESSDPSAMFQLWQEKRLPGILKAAEKVERPKPQTGPRLSDLFTWYIDIYLPAGDRKEKTVNRYRQILDDFLMFCRSKHIGRPQQLNPDTIREWQAWMVEHRPGKNGARSSATRRDEIAVVQRALTTAVNESKLEALPFQRWEKPKARPGTRYKAHSLELVKEVLALVKAERPAIYPILAWLAITGWSPEDAVALTWERLDLRRGIKDVRRMKTGTAYPALITAQERAILEPLATAAGKPLPGALVFALPVESHKQRMQYIHKHLTRLTEKHLQIRVTPRDFRKTFGSLHASGVFGSQTNPKALMMMMAHSNLETTMIYYTDVTEEQLAERAEVGGKSILAPGHNH
jgi:integrase